MEKIYFTKTGIELFVQKIKRDEARMAEMSARLGHLAEVGGDQYHDNFSYEQQTMELRMLSNKLSNDRKVLENATIIEDYSNNNQSIFIGSSVKLKFDQETQLWKILGYGESDPKNYKTAYNTPLGKILMGKKKGDIIKYNMNSKIVTIQILEIV